MKNQNPYKWTYMPRVRHKARRVHKLFNNYYRPNMKYSKDKLLIDESNGNEVFRLPVVQSPFDGWEDPIFNVTLFVFVF